MKLHNFINPKQIKLRARYEGEENVVITTGEKWKWRDAGIAFSINWKKLSFHPQLEPVLKSFIVFRFASKSPRTVGTMDARMATILAKSTLGNSFPWNMPDVISFLTSINGDSYSFSFRSFYEWCVQKRIDGFEQTILAALTEVQPLKRQPYQKAYLQEEIITPSDQQLLINAIEQPVDNQDYCAVRDNALLHLAFELAPRPTQLFSLNEKDLEMYTSEINDKLITSLYGFPWQKRLAPKL